MNHTALADLADLIRDVPWSRLAALTQKTFADADYATRVTISQPRFSDDVQERLAQALLSVLYDAGIPGPDGEIDLGDCLTAYLRDLVVGRTPAGDRGCFGGRT